MRIYKPYSKGKRVVAWYIAGLLIAAGIAIITTMGATAGMAGQSGTGTDVNNPDYYDLVKKLKNNDKNIDFQALRLSYTRTQDYKPYSTDKSAKDAAFEALNKKNYAEAVRQAQSVLETNYVNLDAHMLCKIAYSEMGNLEKYDFHNSVLKGLVSSLYASGDGTAAEGAIVVISVDEEYFLLMANGLKRIKYSTFTKNGHYYDMMDVENTKTAEKMVIYFRRVLRAPIAQEWKYTKLKPFFAHSHSSAFFAFYPPIKAIILYPFSGNSQGEKRYRRVN